jgi:hypothetical protein
VSVKFESRSGVVLKGVLTYDRSEFGFSFDPQSGDFLRARVGSQGVTSASVGTLQLEVDVESREVLFVWGYFPQARSGTAQLNPPSFQPGRVLAIPNNPLQPGVAFDVSEETWESILDPDSGWVVIQSGKEGDAEFTEIADGIFLGIRDGNLVSVWLKPVFVG